MLPYLFNSKIVKFLTKENLWKVTHDPLTSNWLEKSFGRESWWWTGRHVFIGYSILPTNSDWYLCMLSLKHFIGNLVIYKYIQWNRGGRSIGLESSLMLRRGEFYSWCTPNLILICLSLSCIHYSTVFFFCKDSRQLEFFADQK